MSTPPEEPERTGAGWEPQSWHSEWQQPEQTQAGGWQQAPDGRWMQVGAVQSSGNATASLVLGILGLVLCPFVCSVLALVLGYQARREIEASGGRISGRGNAQAGIVLGWIGVAFVLLVILLIVGLS